MGGGGLDDRPARLSVASGGRTSPKNIFDLSEKACLVKNIYPVVHITTKWSLIAHLTGGGYPTGSSMRNGGCGCNIDSFFTKDLIPDKMLTNSLIFH